MLDCTTLWKAWASRFETYLGTAILHPNYFLQTRTPNYSRKKATQPSIYSFAEPRARLGSSNRHHAWCSAWPRDAKNRTPNVQLPNNAAINVCKQAAFLVYLDLRQQHPSPGSPAYNITIIPHRALQSFAGARRANTILRSVPAHTLGYARAQKRRRNTSDRSCHSTTAASAAASGRNSSSAAPAACAGATAAPAACAGAAASAAL